MLQTLPKTIEVLANGLVITPVAADKADDDSPYSAKMCPQPVDLIMDAILEMLPTNPKRERCRVKKRLLVPRRVLPVMARSREHRATPRRDGGARADRSASGDDGGGGGSDDPPAPHPKSEHRPRAEANPPQSVLRAPRVLERRARP